MSLGLERLNPPPTCPNFWQFRLARMPSWVTEEHKKPFRPLIALCRASGGPVVRKRRRVRPGDRFLLCSDGLTEHVHDHEMADTVSRLDAQEACDALVELTLSRGAKDNVTVVVVRCRDRMTAQKSPQTGPAPLGYHAGKDGDEWHVGN